MLGGGEVEGQGELWADGAEGAGVLHMAELVGNQVPGVHEAGHRGDQQGLA